MKAWTTGGCDIRKNGRRSSARGFSQCFSDSRCVAVDVEMAFGFFFRVSCVGLGWE